MRRYIVFQFSSLLRKEHLSSHCCALTPNQCIVKKYRSSRSQNFERIFKRCCSLPRKINSSNTIAHFIYNFLSLFRLFLWNAQLWKAKLKFNKKNLKKNRIDLTFEKKNSWRVANNFYDAKIKETPIPHDLQVTYSRYTQYTFIQISTMKTILDMYIIYYISIT